MDPLAAIGCLDDADIRLDEAGLALAAADRAPASFDLEPALARLARLATRLPAERSGSAARADALADLLAATEGYSGDHESYDAPLNGDLLAVLERRRGLPITLAILYVALARRAGWQARILGLPGHVLVGVGTEADYSLIDPFHAGRRVDRDGFTELVAALVGRGRPLGVEQMSWLDNRQSLVRLVLNEANRARQAGNQARALTLYRRLTLVAPAMPNLWWERARLEQLAGDIGAARRSLAAMRETTRDPDLEKRIRAAIAALAR